MTHFLFDWVVVFLLTFAPQTELEIPAQCDFTIINGYATHVGYRYYPWQETVELRKRWGQIPEGWELESRNHVAALHEAMVDRRFFGRRALVLSGETGNFFWVDIVDAMAAGKRHPNPHYKNRVIDLTPAVFGKLLGYPDGPRGRGGQRVTVMFPECEGVRWPSYAVG